MMVRLVLLLVGVAQAIPTINPQANQGILPTRSDLSFELGSFANRLEQRGWTHISAVSGIETVQLTIAVKGQATMEQIDALWHEVSVPSSPKYGHFLTHAEIGELVRPADRSLEAVLGWVNEHAPISLTVTPHGDYVIAHFTSANAERMLGVPLGIWKHPSSGLPVVRVTAPLTIPSHLSSHVDAVFGVSDFSAKRSRNRKGSLARFQNQKIERTQDDTAPQVLFINNGNHHLTVTYQPHCLKASRYGNLCTTKTFANDIKSFILNFEFSESSLNFNTTIDAKTATCDEEKDEYGTWVTQCITPVSNIPNWSPFNLSVATLFEKGQQSSFTLSPAQVVCGPWSLPHNIRQRYNVSAKASFPTDIANESGVVLFEYQYYSPTDFSKFMSVNSLPDAPANVVNGNPDAQNQPNQPGEEGQADIELIGGNGIGGPPSTFWYSGDGGDGVVQWAIQISSAENDEAVPKVWSLSWGIAESLFEQYVGPGAQERINRELALFGARGFTMVVASGDAGVRPIGRSEFECGIFEPDFPASSPYVLSVGASMFVQPDSKSVVNNRNNNNNTSRDALPICSMTLDGAPLSCDESGLEKAVEVAVSCCSDGAVWTSGAGFSNNYSQPEWQATAVRAYLSRQHENLPPNSFWNASGRAYPDISIVGDKIPTIRFGNVENFGGTSASAPIMAGLIAQLNYRRIQKGLPRVGAIAPLLYSAAVSQPAAFNDITVGHNNCGELMCCEYGFQADKGWDAVTGLGSLNLGLFESVVLA